MGKKVRLEDNQRVKVNKKTNNNPGPNTVSTNNNNNNNNNNDKDEIDTNVNNGDLNPQAGNLLNSNLQDTDGESDTGGNINDNPNNNSNNRGILHQQGVHDLRMADSLINPNFGQQQKQQQRQQQQQQQQHHHFGFSDPGYMNGFNGGQQYAEAQYQTTHGTGGGSFHFSKREEQLIDDATKRVLSSMNLSNVNVRMTTNRVGLLSQPLSGNYNPQLRLNHGINQQLGIPPMNNKSNSNNNHFNELQEEQQVVDEMKNETEVTPDGGEGNGQGLNNTNSNNNSNKNSSNNSNSNRTVRFNNLPTLPLIPMDTNGVPLNSTSKNSNSNSNSNSNNNNKTNQDFSNRFGPRLADDDPRLVTAVRNSVIQQLQQQKRQQRQQRQNIPRQNHSFYNNSRNASTNHYSTFQSPGGSDPYGFQGNLPTSCGLPQYRYSEYESMVRPGTRNNNSNGYQGHSYGPQRGMGGLNGFNSNPMSLVFFVYFCCNNLFIFYFLSFLFE